MDDAWNEAFEPCEANRLYLAEFTWDGYGDLYAEQQFGLWNPDPAKPIDSLFPVGSITKKKVQGYYLTGTRVFWMVVCADREEDVKELCRKVAGKTHKSLSPIRYNYWRCEDPQPSTNK